MAQMDLSRLKGLGLPRVGQLGFIVADAAAERPAFGAIFGISTWYWPKFSQNRVRYGQREYDADWELLFGISGRLQVELIDLRGDHDNIFGPFLAQGGSGLQHLGFNVRDVDEKVARAEKMGMAVAQRATLRTGSGIEARVVFLDARPWCGLMVELIETRMGPIFTPPSRLVLELGVLLGDGEKIRG